jgi:predicted TIM-barrel fold metal-dependent hydrolase
VIEKGLELGIPLFCVHKGLPIGIFFDVDGGNHPRDVGIAAKDYPNAKFIIYHAGFSTGFSNTNAAPPEGPYDPNEPKPVGANALIRSLLDNGIGPNKNVYAEVGSALNQVLKDPTVAAHFFGKLMKYIGTDNVCWGTDCVIYGSPQQFIEPFRRLEIPASMQEQYGYPPLDAVQKAKIFGLNAARPYGIDANAKLCRLKECPIQLQKEQTDAELGDRRWMFEEPNGPKTYGEFVDLVKAQEAEGVPG